MGVELRQVTIKVNRREMVGDLNPGPDNAGEDIAGLTGLGLLGPAVEVR